MGTMPTTSDQELPGELELRAMLDREPGRVHCDGVRVQAMAREVLRLRAEHANHLSVEQILEEDRKGWEERALKAEKVAADLRAEVGLLRTDKEQLRASLRQHEEAEAIRAKALKMVRCGDLGTSIGGPVFAAPQAKPADVLGEAFRGAMWGAAYAVDADQRALELRRAVAELAKVVERMEAR